MNIWGTILIALSLFLLAIFVKVDDSPAQGWLPFLFIVFFMTGMALLLTWVERLIRKGVLTNDNTK